jgi:EAL domain-containing protein (putative c-di-GMP-specific phosphodiesterase class I)
VPVYARLLADSALASMIVDMIALYPEVPPNRICIELSADILYEDLTSATEKIDELRALGVRVAISEVGDQFCPVFRLSEIKFDYAFMDSYSTASLGGEDQDRIAGSLVKYLHYLDVKVVAPALDTDVKISGAKAVGADGYTTDVLSEAVIGGDENEE